MYTYQFLYDENIDGYGSIQFCAASENEATKVLFVCVYLTSGSLVSLPINITLFIFYHLSYFK